MRNLEKITEQLVEWSRYNDCGMPMTKVAIRLMIQRCLELIHFVGYVSIDNIDALIEDFGTDSGYLVKANDVRCALEYEYDQK